MLPRAAEHTEAIGHTASEVNRRGFGKVAGRARDLTDPETGGLIRLVRYPAGVINPWHTHPCGHGMYVLEGKLVTHNGTFGPGSFVWFPEGMKMEHGATQTEDVTALFLTNKKFEIWYQQP